MDVVTVCVAPQVEANAYTAQMLQEAIERSGVPVQRVEPAHPGIHIDLTVGAYRPVEAHQDPSRAIFNCQRVVGGDGHLGYSTSPFSAGDHAAQATVIEQLIEMLRTTHAMIRLGVHIELRWMRSSEVLIDRLQRVVADRDELIRELDATQESLYAAEARIEILEHFLDALQIERSKTPDRWRSPTIVATIAVAVTTLLGPMLGSLTSEAVKKPVREAHDQAVIVQVDCRAVAPPPDTMGPTPTAA